MGNSLNCCRANNQRTKFDGDEKANKTQLKQTIGTINESQLVHGNNYQVFEGRIIVKPGELNQMKGNMGQMKLDENTMKLDFV